MAPPSPGAARIACAALALALLAACRPAPDLVLVTFDTLRRDHVGVHVERAGGSLTPHLDAFAEDARVFENAFTPMPTTVPAHASLLTGLTPRELGIERNGDRARAELGPASLQARLGDAGYTTGAFVTSHVFGDALGLGGFDRWDEVPEPLRPGTDAARAALAWLDEARAPVFLWLHLYDPHSPFGPWARKLDHYPVDKRRYGWVDASLYEDPRSRYEMADLYAQGVREADQALGLLLDGLEARGRRAWVAVASDHGELLDERLAETGFAYGHGSLLSEEVIRVPLVLRGPGLARGRVSAPVTLRDLYTTLLSAAGIVDAEAEAAGRVDLRGALPEARVVTSVRRFFETRDRAKRGLGPAAMQQVRAHAVAASDGERIVVLGEDGASRHVASEDAALRAEAERVLAATLEARALREEAPLDEETRAALEALGYVE